MEKTHTALYRKYRPRTFADVRGQQPIVKALEGALLSGNIPHALLFAGPRGTGKTSMARIFAAAAGAKPIDIYEIDAASNRGIDDIRGLREAVHTLPYESPRKVYIIDEVHMLTKDAFSAFLKTLEEPPAHVMFILATTEQEKLLDTVVSRCQMFQFKAPTRAMLAETVLDVARQETFALDTDAADLIALAADGSFRDALGTMQKVIMASIDEKASVDEVAAIIGAPKGKLVMEVVTALHGQDAARGLAAIEAAQKENVEMKLFVRLILERVRAILLARHGSEKDNELVSLQEEDRSELVAFAKDAHSPINSAALTRLLLAAEQTGRTYLPHLPLELAVIELASKKPI
ncbi:MAG: DNA polymerase III subunit gamma/tau [Patescibacteria group bacterium]|nr:DNA polymerase III subunit gamma/tau [Patescibacteria group bacterium]